MSEFHFQCGQRDAKAGRHVQPVGLSAADLLDWCKGHGPGYVPRSAVSGQRSVIQRANLPTRDPRPYAAFSTSSTKRRASPLAPRPTQSREPIAPTLPQPKADHPKPAPQLGLFGPIEEETKSVRKRLPLPIPTEDRDAERDRLVSIGVGLSAAMQLVKADWTLDQLQCRWSLNDWSEHPKFVQDVARVIAAYCERKPKPILQLHQGGV